MTLLLAMIRAARPPGCHSYFVGATAHRADRLPLLCEIMPTLSYLGSALAAIGVALASRGYALAGRYGAQSNDVVKLEFIAMLEGLGDAVNLIVMFDRRERKKLVFEIRKPMS